jgi:hypothetical protein
MMEYRNIKSNAERTGMTGSRYREIPSPASTDGVGIALRRAFAAPAGEEDFQSLLRDLDNKTG